MDLFVKNKRIFILPLIFQKVSCIIYWKYIIEGDTVPMKRLSVKKNVECMACLECVRACSVAFYKTFDPELSSIRIVAKGAGAKPMTCIQCGKCEKHCPQGIPIREKLKEAKKELETPAFKIAFKLIKKFTHY